MLTSMTLNCTILECIGTSSFHETVIVSHIYGSWKFATSLFICSGVSSLLEQGLNCKCISGYGSVFTALPSIDSKVYSLVLV